MAKFPSLTFTEAGMKMLVQSQNGHTLTFTKGKLGSGVLTDRDDITKFTDLKAPKMELPVVKKDDSQKEKIALTFNTSNTALEEGFVSRELGIFAKLDNGKETLYAYSNAGNDYDYIPNKDTPTDENRLVVNLIVRSSANINVLVDGSIVYAHMSDLDERLQVTTTAGKPASMDEKGLWVEIKSGLKAILHRWNKTTRTYDTLHPETETSQITDFDTAVNGKINTHNSSGTAHSALFKKKVNNDGGTMTGNLELKNAQLQVTRTDDNTSNGKDYQFDPLNIIGSDGTRYGFMRINKKAAGSRQLQIYSVDNQNNPSGSISINTDNNGTAISIQGVTPGDTANDTSMTTAEWVNKKLNDYEKTSSLANDIITKLAQTTAISIISALQAGSWFGQLLKLVLSASGVRYLIDTNGYICLGSFFGNAIIQWVTENKVLGNSEGAYVTLPITFPTKCVTALLSDTYGKLASSSSTGELTEGAHVYAVTKNSVQIINEWTGGLDTAVTVLAIGY